MNAIIRPVRNDRLPLCCGRVHSSADSRMPQKPRRQGIAPMPAIPGVDQVLLPVRVTLPGTKPPCARHVTMRAFQRGR